MDKAWSTCREYKGLSTKDVLANRSASGWATMPMIMVVPAGGRAETFEVTEVGDGLYRIDDILRLVAGLALGDIVCGRDTRTYVTACRSSPSACRRGGA